MATNNAVNTSLSGQSGTGSFAGTTSPSFTTPALGTPSSGTLTNCTGFPASGLSGLGAGVSTALGQAVSGSGGIVLTTSPSLTTPTLGVASATSINFGGSTLANYIASTAWTPVFTFGVPGDLSVSYSTQFGSYVRIGSLVFYTFILAFTPTFSTSSGSARITGLPVTSFGANSAGGPLQTSTNMTYPAGCTAAYPIVNASSTMMVLNASGSNVANTAFNPTHFTSGSAASLAASGFYFL